GLAAIARAAPAVAVDPVLIAEVLEHELPPAPRVIRILDHRAQLAALDLAAPRPSSRRWCRRRAARAAAPRARRRTPTAGRAPVGRAASSRCRAAPPER